MQTRNKILPPLKKRKTRRSATIDFKNKTVNIGENGYLEFIDKEETKDASVKF